MAIFADNEKRLVQHGFGQVEIEKSKLQKTIIENRNKHIEEYNKATKAYEQAKLAYALEFTKQLEENMKSAKVLLDEKLAHVQSAAGLAEEAFSSGGIIELVNINASIYLPLSPKVAMTVSKPESHEKDYNNVIRNLELTTAEFVILGSQEFNQYVLDEWTWKSSFSSNNFLAISGCTMTGNLNYLNASSGISVLGSGISSLGSTTSPFTTVYASNIVGTGTYLPYSTPIYSNKLGAK